jgi:hypothetical protein
MYLTEDNAWHFNIFEKLLIWIWKVRYCIYWHKCRKGETWDESWERTGEAVSEYKGFMREDHRRKFYLRWDGNFGGYFYDKWLKEIYDNRQIVYSCNADKELSDAYDDYKGIGS